MRANGDESFAIKMQITLNDKIKEKAITPKKFNIDTQISLVDLVETDSESLAKTRKEQSIHISLFDPNALTISLQP